MSRAYWRDCDFELFYRLTAEVADLRARMELQTYDNYDLEWCTGCDDPKCRPCLCRRARNLGLKNWRAP